MAVRIRELRPRPPFRLELVAWALRRRAHNTIDRWDGSTYSRTFEHRGMPVHAALTQPTPTRLRLSLSAERLDANAIACQQLSLEAGIALLNRLVAGPGAPFPSPARLARMPVAALRAKGFSTQKARALGAIARAAARHELDAESFAPLDDAAACERLEALPGIGRWSAEYVLLRGLGRLHVFPGDDVGARNNLQRWLRLRRPLDYARVAQVLAPWQPWAGLVYFHLLLESLARAGHLRA